MSKNHKDKSSNSNRNRNTTTGNAPGGEGEDPRKKRGNSQDNDAREAFKKVRSSGRKDMDVNDAAGGNNSDNTGNDTVEMTVGNPLPSPETCGNKSPSPGEQTNPQQEQRIWDLESAIMYLVQIGSARRDAKSKSEKEPIRIKTKETNTETTSTHGSSQNSDRTIGQATENRKSKTDTTRTIPEDKRGAAAAAAAAATTSTKNKKDGDDDDSDSRVPVEYLTHEEDSWITFRAAHAGDASTIAQWYRKQRAEDRINRRRRRNPPNNTHNKTKTEPEEEPELEKNPLRSNSSNEEEAGSDRLPQNNNSSGNNDNTADEEDASSSLQLEHWLEEALGDENTCPFVHGLLAYVHRSSQKVNRNSNDNSSTGRPPVAASPPPTQNENENEEDDVSGGTTSHQHLAAVVLMSLSWGFGTRNLRIEWMSFDSSSSASKEERLALRQKVWLRIHTLSSMTACQGISVDEDTLLSAALEEQVSGFFQTPAATAASRPTNSHSPLGDSGKEEDEPLDEASAVANSKPAVSSSQHKNHHVEPSAE